MREEWMDIRGWEGIYQISNYGRLKSFKREKTGVVLSNKNKNGWYLNVVLQTGRRNSRRWSVKIHTLVATHFIGPRPSDKHIVNHKDCDKQNNRADNLEWVTQRENMLHAAVVKPEFLSGMHRHNKFVRPNGIMQFSLDGEFLHCYRNGAEASKATGVCQRNILQVANKTEYKPGLTRKQAGGYIWENMIKLGV